MDFYSMYTVYVHIENEDSTVTSLLRTETVLARIEAMRDMDDLEIFSDSGGSFDASTVPVVLVIASLDLVVASSSL